jgi:uncharacterized membrane protein
MGSATVPLAAPTAVDRYGFRLRGAQSTRLEAFVDAAFAFAVTVLVVGGSEVPTSIPALLTAMKDVPVFLASFAIIAQIWWSHYNFSQRYGLEDGRTTMLSLALVFLVLVYVYPLKMLFTMFFAWVSQGWLLTRPLEMRIDDLRAVFLLYGVAWAVLSVLMITLLRHALKLRQQLDLNATELLHTRFDIYHWLINLGFGMGSALLAALLPERPPANWMYGAPGLLYFGLGPSHGFLAWRRQRAMARLA